MFRSLALGPPTKPLSDAGWAEWAWKRDKFLNLTSSVQSPMKSFPRLDSNHPKLYINDIVRFLLGTLGSQNPKTQLARDRQISSTPKIRLDAISNNNLYRIIIWAPKGAFFHSNIYTGIREKFWGQVKRETRSWIPAWGSNSHWQSSYCRKFGYSGDYQPKQYGNTSIVDRG